MAEDKDQQDNPEEEKKSGKGKMIIFIVAALLVVAGCVGGTLYMLGFFESPVEEETEESETTEQVVVDKPPSAMYFPIKPAFIVNFPSRGKQRFLQADVTVLTRDMSVFDALQTHLPLIKNKLVMLYGGEVYEELQTAEGKELLRQKSLVALQEIMQQELGKSGVEEVLFTNFVMQ